VHTRRSPRQSRPQRSLLATRFASYPFSDKVSSATPAGPCGTYPGDDTWTAALYADGVVLIGDAAGYSDPTARIEWQHARDLDAASEDLTHRGI